MGQMIQEPRYIRTCHMGSQKWPLNFLGLKLGCGGGGGHGCGGDGDVGGGHGGGGDQYFNLI